MDYRRETTFPELEATRKRFTRVLQKLKETLSIREKCRERVALANSALSDVTDAQEREELEIVLQDAKAAFAQAEKSPFSLQTRTTLMDRAVRQREAAFTQSQLLDFIRSDRYPSTPLTFANAMAGLPVLHWRQSMDRCTRLKDGALSGPTYQQFLFVASEVKQLGSEPGETVERVKARLLRAKEAQVRLCNPLAERWYFLRCAIESVLIETRSPKDEIPYRVFAEYQRLQNCQTARDVLFSEKEVLTTPVYAKYRRESATPR